MTETIFDRVQTYLDMEFFLERESIPFKRSRGVSGDQLHLKTCPACGDNRWRTYFGVETGRGNCFVCNKPFNKINMVQLILGGEWKDIARDMDEILREQGWRPVRKSMVAVQESEVVLPISEPLPFADGSNLDYLERRGFDADIAHYFHLRWCQFGWWKVMKDDGSHGMQAFDDRVIIPVYDLDGTLKTFQGRDVTGQKDRKYLFPVGLPGTGRYLLNGHNVVATDQCAMGEGIFDVAAMKVAFDQDMALRHVVPIGSFGKHLSYGDIEGNDQLGRFHVLKNRGLKIVTIMWDGEPAALTAALSAGKLLTGIGLKVRIALLPAGKDPNEILPEEVREAFYKAQEWSPSLDLRWRMKNPYGRSS